MIPQAAQAQTDLAIAVINSIKAFINASTTVLEYRKTANCFTRVRSLSFATTVYLLLCNFCNSLAVELFNALDSHDLAQFTKSAFTQRRYQIKYELFSKLNELCIEKVYQEGKNQLQKWHGLILCALDGSALVLPSSDSIKQEFGIQAGGPTKVVSEPPAMGLMLAHYDLLNHLILKTALYPIQQGEVTAVYSWVKTLQAGSLTLFDRGYGSFLLFWLMMHYKKQFVVRLKLNFSTAVKNFVASGALDEIITIYARKNLSFETHPIPVKTKLQIRLIRVVLPTGEIEVLATSLDQTAYPAGLFPALYQQRWGVETCFDRLKNKLLALCFVGQKAEAIYQEIYATVFIHNIHQLLVTPAQTIVNEDFVEKKHA